jgi:hypothetical protein
MKRSLWGWFMASLILGYRQSFLLLNFHAFKSFHHLLLKAAE